MGKIERPLALDRHATDDASGWEIVAKEGYLLTVVRQINEIQSRATKTAHATSVLRTGRSPDPW